jgi:catechol 2,3-dioxygenase-like lactoylglutathione lyase family enzyme
MSVEPAQVLVPVGRVRRPQLVERVEDRELHVRVDPVDQGDAAVAEVEDDGVLVLDAFGPDHPARRAVQEEAAVLVAQPMDADAPGPP